MVIVSWMTRFTVLGIKLDQCSRCGQTCEHVVGRKVMWVGVFWLPMLFFGFQHGMVCTSCKLWTGISWRQARAATRTGYLPLDRARPNAQAVLAASAAEGEPPRSPREVYDRMLVNPHPGRWDTYLKVWPVLVALIVVVAIVMPRTGGTTHAAAPATPVNTAPATAHTCWVSNDGSISGCRLDNGTIAGYSTQKQTTCYFAEPINLAKAQLRCDP